MLSGMIDKNQLGALHLKKDKTIMNHVLIPNSSETIELSLLFSRKNIKIY